MTLLESCPLWDDRNLTCKVDDSSCGMEAVGDFIHCDRYKRALELYEIFNQVA